MNLRCRVGPLEALVVGRSREEPGGGRREEGGRRREKGLRVKDAALPGRGNSDVDL